jgi:MinD-like ATPase involved in chromosome partitioning or flagellar assembly
MLKLYTTRHVVGLFKTAVEEYSLDTVLRFAQNHRSNLKVIPAPGHFMDFQALPDPRKVVVALDLLTDAGYQVLLDLGTVLNSLTLEALKRADKTFVITSGQPESNLHLDTFLSSAKQMGLDAHRLLPVINELYGENNESKLGRVPIARIPHASERSRTRLWLTEQGLQKLVAVALV